MRRGESGISCLLGIDKPVGPSSHDVVNRVRRALGERRVGHAGTLDPLASGVLVVGVGQATRLLGMLTLDEKAYESRIAFGSETSTDDAEGEVTRVAEVPEALADEARAREVVAGLVGEWDQVPPAFSAVSVDGRRAYDRARSGEAVELAARRIRIYEARLLAVEAGESLCWDVYLRVSKGTYVRSIARDLGRQLGSAAHLEALRRTASGAVGVERCVPLERLQEEGPRVLEEGVIDPVAALGYPFRVLSEAERADVASGRLVEVGLCVDPMGSIRPPREGELVSLVADGLLVGVWRRSGSRLRSEANFPSGIMGMGR